MAFQEILKKKIESIPEQNLESLTTQKLHNRYL